MQNQVSIPNTLALRLHAIRLYLLLLPLNAQQIYS